MDKRKSKFITKRIKVYGIVQGVGFRPLVYRIAKKLNIKGTVRNVGGYVEIIAQASKEQLEQLVKELFLLQSNGVEIIKLECEELNLITMKEVVTSELSDKTLDLIENDKSSMSELRQDNLSMVQDMRQDDLLKVPELRCDDLSKVAELRQNDLSMVLELRQDDLSELQELLKEDISEATELTRIDTSETSGFIIITSGNSEDMSILPPDLPVCPNCQEELQNSDDRRYRNPFISCMSCGPRYTIMESVPYDRDTTTMVEFAMCPSCNQEYISPESRRFHAQTISCNDCGPYLIFQDNSNSSIKSNFEIKNNFQTNNETALNRAIAILKEGGILAVKGIGGYHLVSSPYNEETVQKLRKLKGREEKPFAVMFPSLPVLEEYCFVSEEERALLLTNARPIVLLYMHEDTMAPSTNKGSIYCGAFLPYTPLQMLLTKECGPLIMTSANVSNQPIIKDDDIMCSFESPYLSGVLYNTRRIIRTVDDSVAKIIDGKPQLIRRSRGYVPYPVFLPEKNNITEQDSQQAEYIDMNYLQDDITEQDSQQAEFFDKNYPKDDNLTDETNIIKVGGTIFAAGGDLKGAFCLYKNGIATVSQYLGDLEEISVMKEYVNSYYDLRSLLKIMPKLAVCDMHPNYHSSQFAKQLGIPVVEVQHHQAHIASVMAEHDLHEKVIGIAFDGTGYGTDGNIWGGEFLVCEGTHFVRAAHLTYTPMLGGDQSMKDSKKTATCYLLHSKLEAYVRDDRKEIIKSALENKINTILSSSIGRLFDAVASILDIGQENSYEGECAALLEKEAVMAKRNMLEPLELKFAFSKKGEIMELDPTPVLETLCTQRERHSVGALALGFHYALSEAIGEICGKLREQYQSNLVAISGGVFQNTVLVERTLIILRQKGFQVFANMAVPPNDGSISLGQAYIGKEYLENNTRLEE